MGSGAEPQRGLGQSPSGVRGRAPRRKNCDFRPTFMRILLYDHTISPTVRLSILHVIYIILNAGGWVHELTLR